jgi:ATP-dependent Clp protease ATP-binding subunit ClpA
VFERFTEPARASVVAAQAHSRDLGHGRVGSQHLVLALLTTPGVAQRVLTASGADPEAVRDVLRRTEGPAADAESLRAFGIDLDEVRRRVEESFGPGALDRPARRRGLLGRFSSDHVPFDRSGKEALEDALRVAVSLRHNYIGTEHLLVGILGRPEGPGAQALRAAGVDLDRERALDLVLAELRRSA